MGTHLLSRIVAPAASVFAALLAGSAAAPALAAGLAVMPTQLRFPLEGGRVQVVQFTNPGDTAVSYEIDVQVEPADTADQAPDDIRVNPSIITLAPGEQARVRVGLVRPPPADRERAYRLYATQLPAAASTTPAGAVGVLMRIGIPLFVDAPGMQSSDLQWSARREGDDTVLTARNPGTRHVRIDGARLVGNGRDSALTIGTRYLHPGQAVDVRIDGDLPVAPGARVVLATADGEQSSPLPPP